MSRRPRRNKALINKLGPQFLPFADAASADLPLGRLLRLSLFQISIGMAFVMLNATLNRVMIVELGIPASLVAIMVALPLLFAPARVLIGHKSDGHKSFLGWRRVPYIWMGTMLQFGGLAIMPFALLVLSGDTHGPIIYGHLGAGLAFLLVGAGMHTTQTTGLALATDLASDENRPRVVALLYVMLLIGMIFAALVLGPLLADFSQKRLIQVVQGCALVTMALNVVALWKQEPRNPELTARDRVTPTLSEAWQSLARGERPGRLLVATGLGTAAFAMQDILLEPYGGEVLGLSVSATTMLTALMAGGTLAGFAWAARALARGHDACRLAALGAVIGLIGFPAIIVSDALTSVLIFRIGTFLIGMGAGLFSVGTLTAAMRLADGTGDSLSHNGIALGAWGAVQATAAGLSIAVGGALRDAFGSWAEAGAFGAAYADKSFGYQFVYHVEVFLVFATLAAIGPLVRYGAGQPARDRSRFGLAQFPG